MTRAPDPGRHASEPPRDPRVCAELREDVVALAELPEAGSAASARLAAHLEACSACRAAVERGRRRVAALRGLARVDPDAALDGLVVAALQAGHRQDRAIRGLQRLGRASAPAGLELRLRARRAPLVLDRLVAEELADPAKTTVRRYAGSLTRVPAPDALDERLGERAPRARRRLASLLVAAAILVCAGALVLVQALRSRQPAPLQEQIAGDAPERDAIRRGLVVERVESLDELDPLAAQLLAGVSGGLLDAQRIAMEEL